MTYRLKLYCDGKLASTELLEASIEEAERLATAVIEKGQAHRVELVDKAGSIIFQLWGVL